MLHICYERYIEVPLELLALEDINQLLRILTSMFITIPIKDSWELVLVLISKENNVFAEILLDATI